MHHATKIQNENILDKKQHLKIVYFQSLSHKKFFLTLNSLIHRQVCGKRWKPVIIKKNNNGLERAI